MSSFRKLSRAVFAENRGLDLPKGMVYKELLSTPEIAVFQDQSTNQFIISSKPPHDIYRVRKMLARKVGYQNIVHVEGKPLRKKRRKKS
jgi:hypothetical protein